MDWHGLMRAGLGVLRLTPAQFWALTPAELQMMLGMSPREGPLLQARLDEMLAAYPDQPKDN